MGQCNNGITLVKCFDKQLYRYITKVMAIVPAIPDKSVIRKYLISILLQAFN